MDKMESFLLEPEPICTNKEGTMRWESQKDIELQALVALYDSVGWTTYTKDPESLGAMVRCSTFVQ